MGKLLILKGADIDAKDIIYLDIIILFLINLILNQSKKLNQKNYTPLHWAVLHNSNEMIELLISKGADINAKDIIYLNI